LPLPHVKLAKIENKSMNNLLPFEDFVNESEINEAKDPTEITSKDTMRITDIIRKAGGDWNEKAKALARQMANAITDAAKAVRRARAAEEENWHEMASIFFNRSVQLATR